MHRNVMRIRIVFCIICTVRSALSLLVTLDVSICRASKLKLAKKLSKCYCFQLVRSFSFLDFLDDDYFQFFFWRYIQEVTADIYKGRSEACCPSSSLLVPIKQICYFNDNSSSIKIKQRTKLLN